MSASSSDDARDRLIEEDADQLASARDDAEGAFVHARWVVVARIREALAAQPLDGAEAIEGECTDCVVVEALGDEV